MSAETSPLSLPSELVEVVLLYFHPFQIVQCRQVRQVNGANCDVAYGGAAAFYYANFGNT
jgi:hypothetical protein